MSKQELADLLSALGKVEESAEKDAERMRAKDVPSMEAYDRGVLDGIRIALNALRRIG